jgi:hypothetical protein
MKKRDSEYSKNVSVGEKSNDSRAGKDLKRASLQSSLIKKNNRKEGVMSPSANTLKSSMLYSQIAKKVKGV